jgi:eukaryotic-like serine/threonine-protein kinase
VPVAAWSVAAAVALAVIAIVISGVSGSSARDVAATRPVTPSPSGATPTASAVTPATVGIAVETLAGRPVAEVHAELAAAGLRVLSQTTRTADVPAGHVVTVSPAGGLPPGSTVTVTYAAGQDEMAGSDDETSGSGDETSRSDDE